MRCLIVNADDFGQDPAFSRGTAVAHDRGIVTSASLMVRWPGAADAVRLAAERPALSLGLHLDLGEWTCSQGEWRPLYEVVDVEDPAAVAAEVAAQVVEFVRLTGRPPTHLDSHQHVHRLEPVRAVAVAVAGRLGVPLREAGDVSYCGGFYGQYGQAQPYPEGITVEALLALVRALPEGTTELGCHPADGLSELATMYREERLTELASLCDPRVREALGTEGIVLRAYAGPPP